MPAKSAKAQRFFGAELARARDGKKTKTGMSAGKLEEMAEKPHSTRSARSGQAPKKPKGYGR